MGGIYSELTIEDESADVGFSVWFQRGLTLASTSDRLKLKLAANSPCKTLACQTRLRQHAWPLALNLRHQQR
jgi:hypothetical protein